MGLKILALFASQLFFFSVKVNQYAYIKKCSGQYKVPHTYNVLYAHEQVCAYLSVDIGLYHEKMRVRKKRSVNINIYLCIYAQMVYVFCSYSYAEGRNEVRRILAFSWVNIMC